MTTIPGQHLADLRKQLNEMADPAVAASSMRFFKTGPGQYGEGDRFLGIRVPTLRRLVSRWRHLSTEHVVELLGSEWHEERLLALLLLVDRHSRANADEREGLHFLYLDRSGAVNNWDLVDSSAEYLAGPHLRPGDETLDSLISSHDVWRRRIAIISTFHWTKSGDPAPTLYVAERLLDDGHDLIHKATGWMLREVGKRDRGKLEAFLRRHHERMPRTALRYAIEHFPEDQRKAWLRGEFR